MKVGASSALALLASLNACASSASAGRDQCTQEAIGTGTGFGQLRADVMVPREFMSGAEISNGGIMLFSPGCDYLLNSFISHETAEYIIENAPIKTLTKQEIDLRLVEGEFLIWKFSDRAEEPRFFIMRTQELKAIGKPRTADEAKRFTIPDRGN